MFLELGIDVVIDALLPLLTLAAAVRSRSSSIRILVPVTMMSIDQPRDSCSSPLSVGPP